MSIFLSVGAVVKLYTRKCGLTAVARLDETLQRDVADVVDRLNEADDLLPKAPTTTEVTEGDTNAFGAEESRGFGSTEGIKQ